MFYFVRDRKCGFAQWRDVTKVWIERGHGAAAYPQVARISAVAPLPLLYALRVGSFTQHQLGSMPTDVLHAP